MRKLSVVLVALVLTANIAVAGGVTTHQDTIRTKKQTTYYDPIDYNAVLYITILLNMLALITFLIYRVTVGITKILC